MVASRSEESLSPVVVRLLSISASSAALATHARSALASGCIEVAISSANVQMRNLSRHSFLFDKIEETRQEMQYYVSTTKGGTTKLFVLHLHGTPATEPIQELEHGVA